MDRVLCATDPGPGCSVPDGARSICDMDANATIVVLPSVEVWNYRAGRHRPLGVAHTERVEVEERTHGARLAAEVAAALVWERDEFELAPLDSPRGVMWAGNEFRVYGYSNGTSVKIDGRVETSVGGDSPRFIVEAWV